MPSMLIVSTGKRWMDSRRERRVSRRTSWVHLITGITGGKEVRRCRTAGPSSGADRSKPVRQREEQRREALTDKVRQLGRLYCLLATKVR